jgi:hypothetical protein
MSSVSISIGALLNVRAIFAYRLPLETGPEHKLFWECLRWGLLMKLKAMKIISMTVIGAGALILGGSAGADGLSGEITLPLNPFSVGAATNYTYELVPNWFVGGSLKANYTPTLTPEPFSAGARLGTNYIINLVDASNLKADAYVGAALNFGFRKDFSIAPELNAGTRATFSISPMAKLYAGLGGKLLFPGAVALNLDGYLGGKFEPVKNLEAYAQVGFDYLGAFSSTSIGLYDLKLGVYYTVIPEVRLGASVGYGGVFGSSGDFRASIGAQFAQKPGTLATPGNFLP